ncbi:MAG: hypothetical protein AAF841_04070 [Pseudomonadota bacterium]
MLTGFSKTGFRRQDSLGHYIDLPEGQRAEPRLRRALPRALTQREGAPPSLALDTPFEALLKAKPGRQFDGALRTPESEIVCHVITRGNNRPGLPMLGITLKHPALGPETAHLIFCDTQETLREPGVTRPDLGPDALFEAEALGHELVATCSKNALRSQRTRLTLSFSDTVLPGLSALIVEDFAPLPQANDPASKITKACRIHASDYLDYYFLETLIGNADHSFTIEPGRFLRAHNVHLSVTGHHIIPVPFDFQFTALTHPHYLRLPSCDPHVSARVLTRSFSDFLRRLGFAAAPYVQMCLVSSRFLEAKSQDCAFAREMLAYCQTVEATLRESVTLRN